MLDILDIFLKEHKNKTKLYFKVSKSDLKKQDSSSKIIDEIVSSQEDPIPKKSNNLISEQFQNDPIATTYNKKEIEKNTDI